MAKKCYKGAQKQLTFCVEYIPAPNANDRLSRAINILLNSMPRSAFQTKQISGNLEEKPPRSDISEGAEGHNTNRSYDHEE
jgi:hypothetical protein